MHSRAEEKKKKERKEGAGEREKKKKEKKKKKKEKKEHLFVSYLNLPAVVALQGRRISLRPPYAL